MFLVKSLLGGLVLVSAWFRLGFGLALAWFWLVRVWVSPLFQLRSLMFRPGFWDRDFAELGYTMLYHLMASWQAPGLWFGERKFLLGGRWAQMKVYVFARSLWIHSAAFCVLVSSCCWGGPTFRESSKRLIARPGASQRKAGCCRFGFPSNMRNCSEPRCTPTKRREAVSTGGLPNSNSDQSP